LAWRIEFTHTAEKQIVRLDRQAQASILSYLRQRVQPSENPRQFGKALHGDKQGLWRYRVGDYRIVAAIEDDRFIVLVVAVGHRREVYD